MASFTKLGFEENRRHKSFNFWRRNAGMLSGSKLDGKTWTRVRFILEANPSDIRILVEFIWNIVPYIGLGHSAHKFPR